MSNRPVYLVVYSSRLFPAHWAMWIPAYDAENDEVGSVGKLIHVQGDPRNGFTHQFVRNHDISLNARQKEVIFLGWTNTANVIDGTSQGQEYTDTTATDTIEDWALYIEAPGPSLRSEGSSSSSSRTRVELQNCQTWMITLIEKLVESEILHEDANTVIENAPRN